MKKIMTYKEDGLYVLHDIKGVSIPVSEEGKYLNWKTWKGGPEAEPMCSPWGAGHFQLGDPENPFFLEFFEIPDGQIALSVEEDPTGRLHIEDYFTVRPKEEAFDAAFRLTEKIIDCLKARGLEHDSAVSGHDVWYWARAIGQLAGTRPFVTMKPHQLRGGKS